MAKPPSKKSLNKKLDALWSQQVKERADNCCEKCGKPDPQAHHIVPRTHRSVRFDVRNGVALCYRHHIHWAHKDVLEFHAWIVSHRPEDVAYVEQKRKEIVQRSVHDLQELYQELQKERKTELDSSRGME